MQTCLYYVLGNMFTSPVCVDVLGNRFASPVSTDVLQHPMIAVEKLYRVEVVKIDF